MALAFPDDDPLWLRYDSVVPNPELYAQITSVAVRVSPESSLCHEPAAQAPLHSVAAELSTALTGLLGRPIPSTCCGCGTAPSATSGGALLVSVGGNNATNGDEGFTLTPQSIAANTASWALYGAFRLLAYVQQHKPLPPSFTSQPAMRIRAWNLWDTLSGRVEQGTAGNSLIWPYALYEDGKPPPRSMLFVAPACNASDPHQQWDGPVHGVSASIRNVATGACLTSMGW